MRTCSWRSVTHQLKRPSLTHSTFPSWLTNIGLWRLTWNVFRNVWWKLATFQPASAELFSLGEKAKEVRDEMTSFPIWGDLDALAEEHSLEHSGVNVHIPRMQYKDQPLEIISMSVECQLCTFFYAAWCCTWIFMGFQELIRLSQNCPFSPPAFVWWEIGCFLTSQGRSVTFSFGFTLSIAFSKPSHLRLSYYCFVIWFAFLWIIGSMVGWSYAWKYLSPSLWTTQAPSIWDIRPDPPPLLDHPGIFGCTQLDLPEL